MPCSNPRDLDIRGGRVMFHFLGWGSVADTMDALGGFVIRLEIRILDLAVEFMLWNDLMGLCINGERGIFCFLGWRILLLGVEDCGGCRGRPRRVY